LKFNALISVSPLSGPYYTGYNVLYIRRLRKLITRPNGRRRTVISVPGVPPGDVRSAAGQPLDRLACHRVAPSRSCSLSERPCGQARLNTAVVTTRPWRSTLIRNYLIKTAAAAAANKRRRNVCSGGMLSWQEGRPIWERGWKAVGVRLSLICHACQFDIVEFSLASACVSTGD